MTSTRQYRVFVNETAGSASESAGEAREIQDAFAAVGIDASVVSVDPAALPDAVRQAARDRVDAVIVAGGDGTVNCAAGVAVELGMVLGVIPLGTFNHFAKDLGMTTDLTESVQWLAQADVIDVDVGEVNGRVFVNNASIGVYPEMVMIRDAIRERRGWGKVRAVPLAAIATLRRLPVHRLRLTVDGTESINITTPFLFIGNGAFDEHGQRVGRRSSITDHRLAVYTIVTTSRWRLVANAIRTLIGGVQAAPQTERRVGQSLAIHSSEATLAIALDGEPTELPVPLSFRTLPGALRVLAQPDPPTAG